MSRNVFQNNDYLTAEELQDVHDQGVITVASTAERDALPSNVKAVWYNGDLYRRTAGNTWETVIAGTGPATLSITGNAGTATKLLTPRTIALTGNGSGSASFDGSGNITITLSNSYATSAASATNADTVDGLHVQNTQSNQTAANQILRTNNSGYTMLGYINSSLGNEGNNSFPARVWGTNGSDSYLRSYLSSQFAPAHSHPYSGTGHTHYWQAVSGPYSVNAGQEYTFNSGKAADEDVWLMLRHSSAYLFLAMYNYAATSYTVKIRNSTTSTNHSGIYVHHLHSWRSAK